MHASGDKIAGLDRQRASFDERVRLSVQLAVFENFRDLDWKPVAIEIDHWKGKGVSWKKKRRRKAAPYGGNES